MEETITISEEEMIEKGTTAIVAVTEVVISELLKGIIEDSKK